MKKITEIEKLKYWLDAEITILHAMLAFIGLLLVESTWQEWAFGIYIFGCVVYAGTRVLYVSQFDKDYLKVPKK